MSARELDVRCSKYFTYRQLIECGETWARLAADGNRVANIPQSEGTWGGLELLARQVLDPIWEHFGRLELTYGFASPLLARRVKDRISPRIDQHAGCEVNSRGTVVCERGGQAVDILVPGVCSIDVALWIRRTLSFDRLYLYGVDRPMHVSHGPSLSGAIYAMLPRSGRTIPRVASDAGRRELMTLFGAQ